MICLNFGLQRARASLENKTMKEETKERREKKGMNANQNQWQK